LASDADVEDDDESITGCCLGLNAARWIVVVVVDISYMQVWGRTAYMGLPVAGSSSSASATRATHFFSCLPRVSV
jgi:hypothetical protein